MNGFEDERTNHEWHLPLTVVVQMTRNAYDMSVADDSWIWRELHASWLAWQVDPRPCHHTGCAICEDRP